MNHEGKVLWAVGAGQESVPAIMAAKELGCFVVAVDGDPDAPGRERADDFIQCDTYDQEAQVTAAREYHAWREIHGAIAMCTDVPFTVASVQEALGLPCGLPRRTASLQDKLWLKRYLQAHKIPTPIGGYVSGPQTLKDLRMMGDWVVKPSNSRGSRGVVRLRHGQTPDWAFERARSHVRGLGCVMFEQWIDGPQVSAETIVTPTGNVTFMLDRNYGRLQQFAPYVIEDGADGPSDLHFSTKAQIALLMDRVIDVLDIKFGTVKGDIVIGPHGPMVIELGLRLSGGGMSTMAIPMMTGVDVVAAAIRMALGEELKPWSFRPRTRRHVAIRFEFPTAEVTDHTQRGRSCVGCSSRSRQDAVTLAQLGLHGGYVGMVCDDGAIVNSVGAPQYQPEHLQPETLIRD